MVKSTHFFIFFVSFILTTNLMASICEQGGTEIFGPIYEDTIWTKANSPYCCTQDIIILNGITLTIEPGVNVLNKYISFLVDGQLIAKGTKAERIVFTSYNENEEDSIQSVWKGIKFTEKSTAAIFDSNNKYQSGSILEYVTIEYVRNYADDSSIKIDKLPYLNNVLFHNNTPRAIYSTCPLILMNCDFTNNGSYDDGGAIYAESTLIVINSVFSNNYSNDRDQDRSYSYGGAIYAKDNLTVIDSSFNNNSTYASSYEINPSGGAYSHGGAIYAEKNIEVTGSNFINNTTYAEAFSEVVRATYSAYGAAIYAKDSLIVTNSNFTKNENSYAYKAGDHIEGSGCYGQAIYGAYLEINNSLFTENSINFQSGKVLNSTIIKNSGIYISPSNESPIIYGCNIFENERYNLVNNSSNDITAIGNYWGTTDVNEIFTKIYDRFDNSSKGEVNFGLADKSYLFEFNKQAPSIPSLLSIHPENHTFSDTIIGSSESQQFTITNTSDIDLVAIENLSITGSDLVNFGFINDNCSNLELSPEESCTVNISFSPTSKGKKIAEILVNNDTKIYLHGTGYMFSIFGKVSTNIAGHENLNMIGATVKLNGTNYSTLTDSQGNFILQLGNDVTSNNYSLTYSASNFTTFRKEVYLENGKNLQIEAVSLKFSTNNDINLNGVLDIGDIIYQLQLLTK